MGFETFTKPGVWVVQWWFNLPATFFVDDHTSEHQARETHMARFKASRFLKSPRVPKAVDPKADSPEESPDTAAAPPAARMAEPMRTRPVVNPQESSVDTSRRVDPGQTMRRVDPSASPAAAPEQPQPVRRVTSADDLSRPTADSPVSRRGSKLVDDKADSSSTSTVDEKSPGERVGPGSMGAADDMGTGVPMGNSVDDYTADDFRSRSSVAGAGRFDDSAGASTPAGSEALPTDNDVVDSLAADEATLVNPDDMTNDGPEMPAGFDQTRGNIKTTNLRGLAGDADEYGTNSMADASGFAEEDADGTTTTTTDTSTTGDQTEDDTTSSASNTQSEDASGARDYLKQDSDGAGQSLDVDDMSDQEVADAVSTEADYETTIRPGKQYLAERDYDVDKMSDEQIVDAIDKEAAYEYSGGKSGTATSPGVGYVDADSGGEDSAQVAADAHKLNVPTTPVRGNIDPTEFGNGAEEATDTSILDMSDPVDADDSTSFGGGAMGTPPPRAGVDYGPDHLDSNPGGGLSDNIGGVGIGHDDGTLDVDLGTGSDAMDPDSGGLIDDLSQMDDPSQTADTPDIGFAVDPDGAADDSPIDVVADDIHHVDRIDDIFE